MMLIFISNFFFYFFQGVFFLYLITVIYHVMVDDDFLIKFEQEISNWFDFRRALREPDRSNFDVLMDVARKYKNAGKHKNTFSITEIIIMSTLIEHQKEISRLQDAIKE